MLKMIVFEWPFLPNLNANLLNIDIRMRELSAVLRMADYEEQMILFVNAY